MTRSNQAGPAQTNFDRLKPGSNRTKTAQTSFDGLKPESNVF
ncbi:hypothetical protein CP02DC14_1757 [Chlamydia psittaci 02DC14]|nr:hypothetical protein CP02DC21_1715 [Chlamydia psittaci 02DC21]EPJ21809.1 hypothetical protein CP08DC60_1383 [Chlamydia psittaci 08DC60]EPJ26119.1 hypothetical protein CP03DC29_1405 [Chlamydia psittaci 03DC29]EPL02673.1 hypothetical protein CP02DC14_1757 [Chlamydia psittaci 02DC14]EPP30325.1 hypothetical protein CPC197_2319 [Chlamydia psittaci C1/97]